MKLDPGQLRRDYQNAQARRSGAASSSERSPSIFRYDFLIHRALRKDARELLAGWNSGTKPGRVLDVGASRGVYEDVLRGKGSEIETLDVDETLATQHRKSILASGFPDGSFDAVVCLQVLEHVEDPWKAAREIARILKPGGAALLSAPHVWFYHPQPGDYHRFTPEGMERLCREAGLEPHEFRSQGNSLTAALQIAAFFAYGILGPLGAPIYVAINLAGLVTERLIKNQFFVLNTCCLAKKPASAKHA